MHKKVYVLDTNVLLDDPGCIDGFDNALIILPMIVLEEVDGLKKGKESVSIAARQVSRRLDDIRQRGAATGTSLHSGVLLEDGTEVRVVDDDLDMKWDSSLPLTNDNRILKITENLPETLQGRDVTLVTKDINLRVKADGRNVKSEDYKNSIVKKVEIYDPIQSVKLTAEEVQQVFEDGTCKNRFSEYVHNQYLYATSEDIDVDGDGEDRLVLKVHNDWLSYIPWGDYHNTYSLSPRSLEQHAALDALMDEDIKCVVLTGKAGVGKSLLALAAGLDQVVNYDNYSQVVITRPLINLGGGKGIGFLPGSEREKLNPWVKPFYDAFESLTTRVNKKTGMKDVEEGWGQIEFMKKISIESLSFVRGRSFNDRFIICDEAQNMTRLEAKTLITRVGKGSKIILLGDVEQIDNPYLTRYSNGLAHVIKNLSGQKIFSHVVLENSERSELAELAATRL